MRSLWSADALARESRKAKPLSPYFTPCSRPGGKPCRCLDIERPKREQAGHESTRAKNNRRKGASAPEVALQICPPTSDTLEGPVTAPALVLQRSPRTHAATPHESTHCSPPHHGPLPRDLLPEIRRPSLPPLAQSESLPPCPRRSN